MTGTLALHAVSSIGPIRVPYLSRGTRPLHGATVGRTRTGIGIHATSTVKS